MKTNLLNHSTLAVVVGLLLVSGGILLIPLDLLLNGIFANDFTAEYISLTLKMGLIFAMSYWLIIKLNIQVTTGLSRGYKWQFKYLNIIPFYLVILGVLSAMALDLTLVRIIDVALLLLACLTVGFAEEFLFRGFLQSMFLKKYTDGKAGRFAAVMLPAVIFGLFHLINLTNNPNVMAVIIQVIFATFIGFYFGILVLKTNKIVPVAITHGLINFSFSLMLLPGLNAAPQTGISLAPIIITLPLFIIGLLVLRKIRKEDVLVKVNNSFK